MAKKIADSNKVGLIYQIAGVPELVKQTQRSYWDMVSYSLTKADLCKAIQDWIDKGNDVVEDVTTMTKPHVGKTHYAMKPIIEGLKIYLKVGIENKPDTNEFMIIISSHTDI